MNVVARVEDVLADMLSEALVSSMHMRIHDVGPVGAAAVPVSAPPPLDRRSANASAGHARHSAKPAQATA